MNGQIVLGPNVNNNTTFTFVNANNGTLSVNATATGTANHYIGNTANIYNTVTGAFGILGAKIDTNGNFVWAKSLCTSDVLASMSTRLCIDKYNNIFYNGSSVSTLTFTNGDIVAPNQAFISKFDPSGNVIYTKSYTNGNALFVVQVSDNMYLWHFYVNTSLNLDGTIFPTNGSLIRVFMIENDNKQLGIALENLGLVPTKYANSGIITTTNPLDVSKVYYINKSNGSLIDTNIYDLVPTGVAVDTNKLLLF